MSHDKVKGIVDAAIKTGGKEFDRKFSISEHALRSSRAEDSINDIVRLKTRILDHIKEKIQEVKWSDPEAVERFCSGLDTVIDQAKDRFIKAHSRVKGVTGLERWAEFLSWSGSLRAKTREEILAELRTEEKVLLLETSSLAPAVPPKEAAKEIPQEIKGALDEGEKKGDDPSPPKPPSEVVSVEGVIESARGHQLSPEILSDVELCAEAIRMGDETLALESLGLVIKQFAKITADHGRDVEATRVQTEEAFLRRVGELQADINLHSENLEKARMEGAQKAQAIEQRDSIIRELKRQLERANTKNDELERERITVEEIRKSLVPPPPEVIEEKRDPDFEQEKAALTEEWTRLGEEEERLSRVSIDVAEWVTSLEAEAKKRFLRERLTTVLPNADAVFKAAEERVKGAGESYRRQHGLIEANIRLIQERKRLLSSRLRALQLITGAPLEESQVFIGLEAPTLPAVGDVITRALVEAQSSKVESVNEVVPVVPEAPLAERPLDLSPSEVDLTQLSFDVELKEGELRRARELEQFIEEMKTRDLGDIEAMMEIPGDEEKDEARKVYIKELAQELKSGELLPHLKKAIVVLGALRNEGKFTARLSSTIGHAIALKDVKLAAIMSPESSRITKALYKIYTVMRSTPERSIIVRRAVGSQYGLASELTPLGESCSKAWTQDLLKSGEISVDQLNKISAYIKEKDDEAVKGKATKKR
jgi:hypothetical protein